MTLTSATSAARRATLVVASALTLVSLGASPARAEVILVTTTADGGAGSLRAAFDTANGNGQTDEIVLQAGATYDLTLCGGAVQENANADGDLDHFAPEGLSITGNGAVIRNTCPDERVIHLVASGPFSLIGTTVTGGDAPGDGGAIESVSGSQEVKVTGSSFVANEAIGDGGAIESTSSPISVAESTFTQNRAGTDGGGDGGALETTDGGITVLRSAIVGNTAGGSGGGIRTCCDTPITITDSVITGNHALSSTGGGIHTTDSPIDVVRSTISDNTAANDGGAVRTSGDPLHPIRVTDSTISGNTSGADGGAFRSSSSPITLTNTTVSGNAAASDGGAFRTTLAPVTANNVTFQGNSATAEGQAFDADASVQLSNTILSGASPICTGVGPFTSGGYNIAMDTTCALTGTGDQQNADPMVAPLADNGGPTQTHALQKGSPAVDAGNPAPPGSGGSACVGTDQRGLPRTGACDIGAYELTLCQTVPVNRIGTSDRDVLRGTPGPDGILAFGGNDRVRALGGNDGVCAGPGKDRVSGGGGKDRLRGEGGRDLLKGGGGKDRLNGGPGKDTCVGQGGKDKATACETEKSIP